jgi:hypothetical protein
MGALTYKKDLSRPGGGVFVALGDARKVNFEDVAEGTIINASDEEIEGEASATRMSSSNDDGAFLSSSAFIPSVHPADDPSARHAVSSSRNPAAPRSTPMVNFTPLRVAGGEGVSNVNPAMDTSSAPGNVRVMNVLDVPQAQNTLEQFALADNGFLEGIPGGMFDWGKSVLLENGIAFVTGGLTYVLRGQVNGTPSSLDFLDRLARTVRVLRVSSNGSGNSSDKTTPPLPTRRRILSSLRTTKMGQISVTISLVIVSIFSWPVRGFGHLLICSLSFVPLILRCNRAIAMQ